MQDISEEGITHQDNTSAKNGTSDPRLYIKLMSNIHFRSMPNICTSNPQSTTSLESAQSDDVEAITPQHSSARFKQAAGKVMKFQEAVRPFKENQEAKKRDQTATESIHAAEWHNVLELYYESYGRSYYLRAADDVDYEEWVDAIEQAIYERQHECDKNLDLSRAACMQHAAKCVYNNSVTQIVISVFLLTNFVISIIQCEGQTLGYSDSELKQLTDTFDFIEIIFTFVYLGELLLNMYGHWFWSFFCSGWNWFDLIIVIVSVIDACFVISGGTGSSLSVLRLLRVFRIVRIFNKLEDMKCILNTSVAASVPLINAFLLFAVVVSIYAVLAVNLFATKIDSDDTTCSKDSGCFASFSFPFHTLLGIATGEDWTPYLHELVTVDGRVDAMISIFFVSYICLVGIVAVNIIVAVLVQGFLVSIGQHESNKRIGEEAREHHRCAGPLDPLLSTLANFISPQHFASQIELLFHLWDVDDNGSVDFTEMSEGIHKLGYDPAIVMSTEGWDSFVQQGLLLNDDDELDRSSFELAMRFQLAEYSQRLLANKMQQCIRSENEYAPVLFAIKMANLEITAAASDRRQSADSARRKALLTESTADDLQLGSILQAPVGEVASSGVQKERIALLELQLESSHAKIGALEEKLLQYQVGNVTDTLVVAQSDIFGRKDSVAFSHTADVQSHQENGGVGVENFQLSQQPSKPTEVSTSLVSNMKSLLDEQRERDSSVHDLEAAVREVVRVLQRS